VTEDFLASKKLTLITGGAGLIGSACIHELNKKGFDDIFIVDHLGESEKWKNLSRLKFVDYMEKGDFIYKLSKDPSLMDKFDRVLHLGACSSTTETDSTYLIRNNYQYTKTLAELSLERSIRFVYASSAATYGNGENGYDDRAPIDSLKPLNMYGYSKHLFDLHAQKTGLLSHITGLKYFNVFGYGEFHKGEMRSLVLKGYEQIRDTGKLKLFKSYRPEYTDGEQKRDFLYVKDAAKISLFFLENEKAGLFNVGRGIAESWNQLAGALFSAMGKPIKIEYIEMPEVLRGKYQYYTCAETKKLVEAGYTFGFTSLESSIQEYVNLIES
jgi:ADP-L-glycero-D-manno-heptose 6-epimerase